MESRIRISANGSIAKIDVNTWVFYNRIVLPTCSCCKMEIAKTEEISVSGISGIMKQCVELIDPRIGDIIAYKSIYKHDDKTEYMIFSGTDLIDITIEDKQSHEVIEDRFNIVARLKKHPLYKSVFKDKVKPEAMKISHLLSVNECRCHKRKIDDIEFIADELMRIKELPIPTSQEYLDEFGKKELVRKHGRNVFKIYTKRILLPEESSIQFKSIDHDDLSNTIELIDPVRGGYIAYIPSHSKEKRNIEYMYYVGTYLVDFSEDNTGHDVSWIDSSNIKRMILAFLNHEDWDKLRDNLEK